MKSQVMLGLYALVAVFDDLYYVNDGADIWMEYYFKLVEQTPYSDAIHANCHPDEEDI